MGETMDEAWLCGFHSAAQELLATEDARRAYVGVPFVKGQRFVVNHYQALVDVVEGAERQGLDPWPYVREWALRRCRAEARALNEAMARAMTEARPGPISGDPAA